MRIGIIGAGFSGTILATRLLQAKDSEPFEIYLFEKSGIAGKGVAYSTRENYHLLNVVADKMSALPEDPNHFINWLQKNNHVISQSRHVPRKLYGEYIGEILQQAIKTSHHKFELITNEVTDINIYNEFYEVIISNSEIYKLNKIVLALGNFSPGNIIKENNTLAHSLNICNDPWACKAVSLIQPEDDILIVGSGLTMADTCMSLYHNHHKGMIYCVSTHSYLPAVHHYGNSYPSFYNELENARSLLEVVSTVKKHIRIAESKNIGWRSVIDSLRPHTQRIWKNLSLKDKQLFMKRLNRMWNVARHRIPVEYQEMLNDLQEKGRLHFLKGRVAEIQEQGYWFVVKIKDKTTKTKIDLKVNYIINCTGPQTRYDKIAQPLVRNLLSKNLIEQGPLGIGINSDDEGRIIVNGKVSDTLFTIGPPRAGSLLESTAVPELREQAKELAELIVKDLVSTINK